MEFLKELDDKPPPRTSDGRPRPTHARTTSTPLGWRSHPSSPMGRASPDERTPLTRSYSTADLEGANEMEYTGQGPVAGGTIMGIHNLAIVFPQFIARLILILFPCGVGANHVCVPIHFFFLFLDCSGSLYHLQASRFSARHPAHLGIHLGRRRWTAWSR